MARFGRILTAMVTPFDDAGELNVDAAVKLAKRLSFSVGLDRASNSTPVRLVRS